MRFVRLATHALGGAVICAFVMALLLHRDVVLALITHALIAPLLFSVVSWSYFRRGRPLGVIPVGLAFAASALGADLVVMSFAHDHRLLNLPGMWVGLTLIFVATCVVHALNATQPWKRV